MQGGERTMTDADTLRKPGQGRVPGRIQKTLRARTADVPVMKSAVESGSKTERGLGSVFYIKLKKSVAGL